jgi:hypothetical protein
MPKDNVVCSNCGKAFHGLTQCARVPRYSHAFDIAFEITSYTQDASDVTAVMIREAITARLASLSDEELDEAVGAPYESSAR